MTAVPAAAVVAEAAVAFELARADDKKFGGDSLAEMRRSYDVYVSELARRGALCSSRRPTCEGRRRCVRARRPPGGKAPKE